MRIPSLPGQSFKGPRDARKLERSRVRDDEITGKRRGANTVTPASQPS
jgi:hypothetical protein